MAVPHAKPGELVDVRPLGPALESARTTALVKTDDLELVRLVLHAGKEIAEHTAPGALVVQCLEGRVAFTCTGETRELTAGQLLHLPPGAPHALRCVQDASLLLTIVGPR